MMKRSLIILIALCIGNYSQAQQVNYNWRLGISGGFSNYYGDLSPYPIDGIGDVEHALKLFTYNDHYSKKLSGQISLERRLTPTTGLMFHYGQYNFGMSDRYIRPDGSLKTDTPHYARALNFNTDATDAGVSLVFKADNGRFLPEKSLIAPYLTLGGGHVWYEVKGDLLDADGNQYDYSNPALETDGRYETNLTKIETEEDGHYDTRSFYVSAGLGFRIRLGNKLELFAQSTLKRTFTDYLDDVSGMYKPEYPSEFEAYAARPTAATGENASNYRGNKSHDMDWFIYNGAGIRFSFGSAKSHFKAPSITSSYNVPVNPAPKVTAPTVAKKAPQPVDKPIIAAERPSPSTSANGPYVVNNYYNFLNTSPQPHWAEVRKQLATLYLDMDLAEQQRRLVSIQQAKKDAEQKLSEYGKSIEKIQSDTSLTEEEKTIAIKELQYFKGLEETKLKDLDLEEEKVNAKIHELEAQKNLLQTSAASDSTLYSSDFNRYSAPSPTSLYNGFSSDTIQDDLPEEEETSTQQAKGKEVLGAQSPDASATAPAQQYYYFPVPTSTTSTTSTPTPQTQPEVNVQPNEEKEKRGWIPIPIIFSGNKKNKKAKKSAALVADSLATTSENQAVVAPAVAAVSVSDSTGSAVTDSLQQSADQQLLPQNEPSEVITTKVDTIFVQGKDITTLLPSKVEIYFGLNEKTVSAEEKQKLESVANYAKADVSVDINLEGFADNTGSVSYNLKLIEERMNAVKQVLTAEYNIPEERIHSLLGGQILRDPIKKTPFGSDRRVEVSLIIK